eukprot:GHVL01018528.1.p1 GENE.GHVL01018528.1~~GHVL01018528.1.p1  ORF type:complete len:101 (+),score=5.06 GHVL01018528.1:420-722(+)
MFRSVNSSAVAVSKTNKSISTTPIMKSVTVADMLKLKPAAPSTTPRYFTVTVHKKPSDAKYYLNDTEEVSDLLESLSKASMKHRCSVIEKNNRIVPIINI